VQKNVGTVLCPSVGTVSHQRGIEVCTVYGRYVIKKKNY